MKSNSNTFSANVFKLLIGSGFAQGLGFLIAPIVTRLFAPEAFGQLSLFNSIAAVFAAIVCMRYELSIILPETDEKAANLVGVSLFWVCVITLSTSAGVLIAGPFLTQFFKVTDFEPYLWFIPISVGLRGISLVFTNWNSRKKEFTTLSIAQAVASTTTQVARLAAGFTGMVSGGSLILARIVHSAVYVMITGRKILKNDYTFIVKSISVEEMIKGLKRYKKFPLYNSWSGLLNILALEMPVYMLSFFFAPAQVGLYTLGRTVLSAPMFILGKSLAKVFYQRASESTHQKTELPKLVKAIFQRLVSLGIMPCLMMILIGEDLFQIAFGERWTEAGLFVSLLSVMMFLQFISFPISMLFYVVDKQNVYLFFDILMAISRIGALVWGGMTGDIVFTIAIFSTVSSLCYLAQITFVMRLSQISLSDIYSCLFRYFFYSLPVVLVISLAKHGFHYGSVSILILSGISGIVYYSLIIKNDESILKNLRGFKKT